MLIECETVITHCRQKTELNSKPHLEKFTIKTEKE